MWQRELPRRARGKSLQIHFKKAAAEVVVMGVPETDCAARRAKGVLIDPNLTAALFMTRLY